MKLAMRVVVIMVVLVCALGVVWMFKGRAASNAMVGNANVVGGIAGALALVVAVLVLWSPVAGRRDAGRRPTEERVVAVRPQTVSDYLATGTLQSWRAQAKDRRITTPSPAAVRWGWASEDLATPAQDLQSCAQVLTAGVVTQLREQLYDRLGGDRARVVVLGGPGAGKTAAMLLLVIDILEHRPTGSRDPVPVWLTLGGWNPDTTSLQEWAAATLTRDYPGLATTAHSGSATAAELIRTGQVALFMDGLDEMPPAVQGTALQTIDRDAQGLRVVLTSRTDEYRAAVAQGRLYGAAVINLLPVGIDQAEEFLLAEQLGARRSTWQHVTDQLREHPDSIAARALTTPLALSLARDTYATNDPATTNDPTNLLDTAAHPTPQALLQHLLARSLTLAYPDSTERDHARRWLSWIAQHMGANRDLRWWDIPTWTPPWQRRLVVGLTVGLTAGLVVGAYVLMLVWMSVWNAGSDEQADGGIPVLMDLLLLFALSGGLACGLTGGLVGGLVREPQIFTTRWAIGRELFPLVAVGLVVGQVFLLALWLQVLLLLDFNPEAASAALLMFGSVGWVVATLVGGLMSLLLRIWRTPLAAVRAVGPLESYRADRRRTLMSGLASGLASGLVSGLVMGLVTLVGGLAEEGFLSWLLAMLLFGLLGGLAGGLVGVVTGGPALQLAVVELIWRLRFQRVRFMPLLETALERQVLRRTGAVYQFRHADLQDFLRPTHRPPSGSIPPTLPRYTAASQPH